LVTRHDSIEALAMKYVCQMSYADLHEDV
jgi:hypothetical protein